MTDSVSSMPVHDGAPSGEQIIAVPSWANSRRSASLHEKHGRMNAQSLSTHRRQARATLRRDGETAGDGSSPA